MLVYPLKYSFNGVKYITMKEVDNNKKKMNTIDPARFIVEDEKSFFFASVFSLTKRM